MTCLTNVMGATTPGGNRISGITCPSSFSDPDNSLENISVCPLSLFNITNLSEASLFGDAVEERSFGAQLDGETDPFKWDNLWRGIPLGIVLAFLCLLTTVGNILVLHAVRTEKRLQTVSNLFIVSLAVADVIVGIIVMPMSTFYIFTERWMLGVAACQIWMSVDYTASTASILNLFILSLDRYWSVRQPLKYLHKRTKRRALSMIAVVWVVSSLWIIPISSWHYFAHGGSRTVPLDKCDTEYAKNSFFKIITAFFNFYLPLTVMYILYLRIFIAIRKRSEFELGQRSQGGAVLSFKSNIPNSHSMEGSEFNNDMSCSTEQRISGTGRTRENGTRSHIASNGRHHRVLALQRHARSATLKGTNSGLYKVEYIYDEHVLEHHAEQIERYFYEDNYHVKCLSRPRWMTGNERNSGMNNRPGLQRSTRHLGDFKLSSKCHSTSSLATSSFKNECSCLQSDKEVQQVLIPENICPMQSFSKPQKTNSKSLLKLQESVQLDDCTSYEPRESSLSTSVSVEHNHVVPSLQSSASITEDIHINNAGQGAQQVQDVRVISDDNVLETDLEKREASIRMSREISSRSRVINIRQENLFLNKTSEYELASNNSADRLSNRVVEYGIVSSNSADRLTNRAVEYGIAAINSADRLSNRVVEYGIVSNNSADRLSNRAVEYGIASINSADRLSYTKVDDSENDLQNDENRSFTSVKSGLKERLGTIRQSSSLNTEIKAAKQLGVIMGAFTLCFLPYFILFLVVSFCDNCIVPGHLTAATWIGYLNSTLNPFLYPLCNINFRNKFRSMFSCSSPGRSPLRVTQTDYMQRTTNFQSRYD